MTEAPQVSEEQPVRRMQVSPTKVTDVTPVAVLGEREYGPGGEVSEYTAKLVVTPFEVILVRLHPEQRELLQEQWSGGVIVPPASLVVPA